MSERKSSMVAGMLDQLRLVRRMAHDTALADLWRRNKLSPNATGYKIIETPVLRKDGREVVEYQLYKLIDASVTTITADIASSVAYGTNLAPETKSVGNE